MFGDFSFWGGRGNVYLYFVRLHDTLDSVKLMGVATA